METFSTLLALSEGNPPVTGEFPSQRVSNTDFNVFFNLRLNKRLSKQSRRRWFETPLRSLWRPFNVTVSFMIIRSLFCCALLCSGYAINFLIGWCFIFEFSNIHLSCMVIGTSWIFKIILIVPGDSLIGILTASLRSSHYDPQWVMIHLMTIRITNVTLYLRISIEIKEGQLWHAESYRQHSTYDDVIKWKHFPRYCPFVWGIHRSTVNSPHKGQWGGALMFSFICAWINGWVNKRGD